MDLNIMLCSTCLHVRINMRRRSAAVCCSPCARLLSRPPTPWAFQSFHADHTGRCGGVQDAPPLRQLPSMDPRRRNASERKRRDPAVQSFLSMPFCASVRRIMLVIVQAPIGPIVQAVQWPAQAAASLRSQMFPL